MTIVKNKPKSVVPSAEHFIADAPDSGPKPDERERRGKKKQISITIGQSLLERIDVLADKLEQTRAAVISMAIYSGINSLDKVGEDN